jgi:hypothetical protein
MCVRKFALSVLVLIIFCVPACTKKTIRDQLLSDGFHNVTNYAFDPLSPIDDRIAAIPPHMLEKLMLDDQRNDYQAYVLSSDEKKMFTGYCEKLPPENLRVMHDSLLKIYFVRNFAGAGMTDFVLSADRKVYTVLFINPEVLTAGISRWVSERENSMFIKGYDSHVDFDCGRSYTALMYVLLHESSHIVDYVHPRTPFVEPAFAEAQGLLKKANPFTDGVWDAYDVIAGNYAITESRDLHAYGISPPAIDASKIPSFYARIFRTPLVSAYAAKNWAEDFADSMAFFHFTQKLNQPCTVTIYEKGKAVAVYRPMDSPFMEKRLKTIADMYK